MVFQHIQKPRGHARILIEADRLHEVLVPLMVPLILFFLAVILRKAVAILFCEAKRDGKDFQSFVCGGTTAEAQVFLDKSDHVCPMVHRWQIVHLGSG